MNTEKIEANSIYEMQKEILKSIKQIPDEIAAMLPQRKQQEIDWSALEEMLQQDVQKPQKVKHLHTHTISIQSSRVFILIVVLCLMVLGLLYWKKRSIPVHQKRPYPFTFCYPIAKLAIFSQTVTFEFKT